MSASETYFVVPCLRVESFRQETEERDSGTPIARFVVRTCDLRMKNEGGVSVLFEDASFLRSVRADRTYTLKLVEEEGEVL